MTISTHQPRPTIAAMGKGIFLQKMVAVTIPAELDGEIKRKLNSVLVRTKKGLYCTNSRREDLLAIALTLGQDVRPENYVVKLYGYERAAFYAFLIEQECWFNTYWPGADRTHFHLFSRQLKRLIGTVDTCASRPVTGKG